MDGSTISRSLCGAMDYRDGMSMDMVAHKHNVGPGTVRDWLLRHNIPIRTLSQAGSLRRNGADGFEWTETRIGRLKDLWLLGRSASQIAAELRCSRNGVIGKARRLKLPSRKSPIIRTGKPKPTIVRLRAAIAKRYVVKVPKAANNGQKSVAARKANRQAEEAIKAMPVIYDRDNGQQEPKGCLFIERSLSDPAWGYCQATATEYGGSWCAEHRKRVFVCREVQVGEMKEAA